MPTRGVWSSEGQGGCPGWDETGVCDCGGHVHVKGKPRALGLYFNTGYQPVTYRWERPTALGPFYWPGGPKRLQTWVWKHPLGQPEALSPGASTNPIPGEGGIKPHNCEPASVLLVWCSREKTGDVAGGSLNCVQTFLMAGLLQKWLGIMSKLFKVNPVG